MWDDGVGRCKHVGQTPVAPGLLEKACPAVAETAGSNLAVQTSASSMCWTVQ